MGTDRQRQVVLAGEAVPYRIRRRRRTKHLLLHVDEERGVEVVVPWHVSFRAAERFVASRSRWLAERWQEVQSKRAQRRKLITGDVLSLFDQDVSLVVAAPGQRKSSRVTMRDGQLHVYPAKGTSVRVLVERWYAARAREFFTENVQELVARINQPMPRIRIGKYRSQWGSCTGTTSLSFNWRLMLGPRQAARYVVAHEVAHMVHPNHSTQYWQLVLRLMPDYRYWQRWLKRNGQTLRL